MKIAVLAIFIYEFAPQTQEIDYSRHPWRQDSLKGGVAALKGRLKGSRLRGI